MRKGKMRSAAGRPTGDLNFDSFVGRLGAKIRQRRLELDMTLQDVALATDGVMTGAMLSQYECGDMEPRLSKFLALVLALGVELTDLLPEEFLRVYKLRRRSPFLIGSILKSVRPTRAGHGENNKPAKRKKAH